MKTFPVNLLLAGRSCLVVGGGEVAARKVRLLRAAGAEVLVAAPELCPDMEECVRHGHVAVVRRPFEPPDLTGVFLAFAATDSKEVNTEVLRLSRKAGALGCAVDANWPHGDFITPASVEKEGVMVSVSTSGASCRRTRLIKENLARHLDLASDAELLVLGTDHNYLSLAEREQYHLVGDKLDVAGDMLTSIWGVHEFMLLNTCNRLELLAVVSPEARLEGILRKIFDFDRLPCDRFYAKYGLEAFGHLASVAAGLMSQTPGEKHITAQLKSGLEYSKDKGWAGTVVQEWFDSALHVAKHVRQEVEPILQGCEIEDVTVKFLADRVPRIEQKRVLLLGTGMVGQFIARKLAAMGCHVTWFYHLTRPEIEPALRGNFELRNLNELKDHLTGAQLIITVATTSAYLLHHGHAPFMEQAEPILAIDLGTPRNISPELPRLMPSLKVVNLDDLKHWHRRNVVDMSRLFEISNKVIAEHAKNYEKIVASLKPGSSGRRGHQTHKETE